MRGIGIALGLLLLIVAANLRSWRTPFDEAEEKRRTEAAAAIAAASRAEGVTVASRRAVLAAEIVGRLGQLNVREGDRVSAGQELAQLDDAAQRARVARAEHEAATATDAERDAAAGTLALELAVLEQHRLVAPFAGLVAERHAEEGEVLAAGAPLLTLVQLDPLDVEADCALQLMKTLTVNRTVRVVPIDPNWPPRDGVIWFAGRVANTAQGTFQVRVEVANEDGGWPAGLPVRLEMPSTTAPGAAEPTEVSHAAGGR